MQEVAKTVTSQAGISQNCYFYTADSSVPFLACTWNCVVVRLILKPYSNTAFVN